MHCTIEFHARQAEGERRVFTLGNAWLRVKRRRQLVTSLSSLETNQTTLRVERKDNDRT